MYVYIYMYVCIQIYVCTYIYCAYIYIYHHVLRESSQHINMMFVAKKYLTLILITLIFQPIWSDKSHLNVAAILLLFLGWLWLRFTFLAWSNPVAVGRNLILLAVDLPLWKKSVCQWVSDDIPYMKWKITAMFETTNQNHH